MKITILGTGPSSGVPLLGCKCHVCTSKASENKRLRSSIYIETKQTHILVDTSPDLRQQALSNHITKLDAILYTHEHADHTNGFDEIRSFNYLQNKTIPIYGAKEQIEELQSRFSYGFKEPTKSWYLPCCKANIIENEEVFHINGLKIKNIALPHGNVKSLAFRIDNFVYSTDFNEISTNHEYFFENMDLWIVDCLKESAHPSHANLTQVLEWVEKFKPKKTILTHMNHRLDYFELKNSLPTNIFPAYDNMVLEV